MRCPAKTKCERLTCGLVAVLIFAWLLGIPHLAAQDRDYLSDPDTGIALTHSQAWGDFGRDTAAARPGGLDRRCRSASGSLPADWGIMPTARSSWICAASTVASAVWWASSGKAATAAAWCSASWSTAI
jgi:hypothetical protein